MEDGFRVQIGAAMSSIDTHRIVKRLKDAGFTDVQAETVTDVVREARELDFSHLATKADLQTSTAELRGEMAELKNELRGEMAELRSELKGEMAELRTQMAELKAELIRYMVTISLGTGALIVALVKLIPGGH